MLKTAKFYRDDNHCLFLFSAWIPNGILEPKNSQTCLQMTKQLYIIHFYSFTATEYHGITPCIINSDKKVYVIGFMCLFA